MARLDGDRKLEQRLDRHEIVAHLGELLGEVGTGGRDLTHDVVPVLGTNRVGVPRVDRVAALEAHAVDRRDQTTDGCGIEPWIAFTKVDPLVETNAVRIDVGHHLAIDRAHDGRHRHAAGQHRVLERGVVVDLGHIGRLERLFHRPGSLRGRQPPHLADLAAGNRPGQHGIGAERIPGGELVGMSLVEHQLRPIQCSASNSMLRIRADRS